MRVCIPTETGQGLKAAVFGYVRQRPFFTDSLTPRPESSSARDNQGQVHAHGACHPVGAIDGLGVQAVVCGGMGLRALQRLEEAGLEVYRSGALTVEEALREIAGEKSRKAHGRGRVRSSQGVPLTHSGPAFDLTRPRT